MKERRKYIRFDVKTKVKFKVTGTSCNEVPTESVQAFTRNLSAEGICFEFPVKLNKGDKLVLGIQFSGREKPVKVEGVVAWIKPEGHNQSNQKYLIGAKLLTIKESVVDKFISHICDKLIEPLT